MFTRQFPSLFAAAPAPSSSVSTTVPLQFSFELTGWQYVSPYIASLFCAQVYSVVRVVLLAHANKY